MKMKFQTDLVMVVHFRTKVVNLGHFTDFITLSEWCTLNDHRNFPSAFRQTLTRV
jgi:hypothetical protein